jgi:hypothetical protein
MTISVKLLNDQIKKISETNTLLDMLLEFEKTLDNLDLYAYKNWSKGEVVEGPTLDRHYVTVKLMYKGSEMPDPNGAKRLFSRDCLVKYTKDDLVTPLKVKTFDDIETKIGADGQVKHRAKTKSEQVWIVSVKMPRRYVDEFTSEKIQADEDSFVDTDNINVEDQAQVEQQFTSNDALGGEI